jgi:hypothetical protein
VFPVVGISIFLLHPSLIAFSLNITVIWVKLFVNENLPVCILSVCNNFPLPCLMIHKQRT